MGYEGNYDIYKCDHCRTEARLRRGQEIDEYPSWTNQKWTKEIINGHPLILCRDCDRKKDRANEKP
jgi:hypothetical protein